MLKTPVQSEDIEKMVGRCLNRFTQIEMALADLFLHLNKVEYQAVGGPHNDEKASEFQATFSFAKRLRDVDELVFSITPSTDNHIGRYWKKLSANLSDQNKKRNEVAHFRVIRGFPHLPPGHEYMLLPFFSISGFLSGELPEPVTYDMLHERVSQFEATRDVLYEFSAYIHKLSENALIFGMPGR
jgi:hypothetical protein